MASYRIAGPHYCPATSDFNVDDAAQEEKEREARRFEIRVTEAESDALDDLMADDATICDWLSAISNNASLEMRILDAQHRLLAELFDGGLPAPHRDQSEREAAQYDRIESLIYTLRDAYEQWLTDSGVLRQTAERIAQAQADDVSVEDLP